MNSNDLFASKVAFKQEMERYIRSLLDNGRIFISNNKTQWNMVRNEKGEPFYIASIYEKAVGQGYSKLFVAVYEMNDIKNEEEKYKAGEVEFWRGFSLNEQYSICEIADRFVNWRNIIKNKED